MKKQHLFALLVFIAAIFGVLFFVTNKKSTVLTAFQNNKTITPFLTETPNASQDEPTQSPDPVVTTDEKTSAFFLDLTTPQDHAILSSGNVTIKGKTSSKAEVFVNEKETRADGQGFFSVDIFLDEGENTISVLANDQEGNSVEKEITVTVDISG